MTETGTDEQIEDGADSGVKQVGAEAPSAATTRAAARAARAARAKPARQPADQRTWRLRFAVVALLGLIGTATFGLLWASVDGSGPIVQQDPTVKAAASKFLIDMFNFNAKSVDSDFDAITAMATGAFANQANTFFNTAIRTELEKALAESRGQIRVDYVQSENKGQTSAELYAVVDQVYVNNKINTPQTDQVRLIMDLTKVNSVWKISKVTVLEGATPASVGTASGSAGSNVPGQ